MIDTYHVFPDTSNNGIHEGTIKDSPDEAVKETGAEFAH